MNKRNALRLMAAGAGWAGISAALGLGLAACSEETRLSFNAVDITGADYAKNFSLKDADGKVRTLADFKGKLVVLFFGYAQCPDVCPTTMTEMAQVKQQLGKDGDKLQVLFITVDPARDTPEVLRAFVANFHPRLIGLTGSEPDIAATARTFHIARELPELSARPRDYLVNHSQITVLYGPQGEPIAIVPVDQGAEAVAAELDRWVR